MSTDARAHDLVTALKDISLELGRVPSRAEFEARVKGGRYRLQQVFGTYSALIAAAGLTIATGPERARSAFMSRDLVDHLESRVETIPRAHRVDAPILVIGDTHFPFAHKEAIAWIYQVAKKLKPKAIVQIGDLYDLLAWSAFPKSMNTYTPKQEIELARSHAEEFWTSLRKASPDAKCFQLIGNHDVRPMKRLLENAPALEVFIHFDPWFEFDGVETIKDSREELVLNDVVFIHGHKAKLGAHRDFMSQNVVVGHSHTGGVVFRALKDRIVWELNAGFVGDAGSKAFTYTPQKTVSWTLGVGVIDALGPRFVPFPG